MTSGYDLRRGNIKEEAEGTMSYSQPGDNDQNLLEGQVRHSTYCFLLDSYTTYDIDTAGTTWNNH